MTFAYAKKDIGKTIVTVAKTKLSQLKFRNAIKIPGFNKINFIADQKEQITKLHNPKRNNCFFKISIILDDDTVIWTSDLIAPGEKVENITLLQTLDEGTYDDVTIKYECISLNKKSTFNSSKIKIKLIVEKNETTSNEKEIFGICDKLLNI